MYVCMYVCMYGTEYDCMYVQGQDKRMKLDRGSIRSSLRYGLSTPCKLTIRNSARLFHIVLFKIGDMHLVLPELSLSTLNAGILIMIHQVKCSH